MSHWRAFSPSSFLYLYWERLCFPLPPQWRAWWKTHLSECIDWTPDHPLKPLQVGYPEQVESKKKKIHKKVYSWLTFSARSWKWQSRSRNQVGCGSQGVLVKHKTKNTTQLRKLARVDQDEAEAKDTTERQKEDRTTSLLPQSNHPSFPQLLFLYLFSVSLSICCLPSHLSVGHAGAPPLDKTAGRWATKGLIKGGRWGRAEHTAGGGRLDESRQRLCPTALTRSDLMHYVRGAQQSLSPRGCWRGCESWRLGGHYACLVNAERWWPPEQEGKPMSCERVQAVSFAKEDKGKFNIGLITAI